jgi:hypothetical protein
MAGSLSSTAQYVDTPLLRINVRLPQALGTKSGVVDVSQLSKSDEPASCMKRSCLSGSKVMRLRA